MGRHEIRLRRQMMTSRRIQRHKNYAGLLEQHRKLQRNRSIMRWVVYVLLFLVSMLLVYYVINKSDKPIEKQKVETPVKDNTN